MLIAETEYRYHVEEDIKPFRDVLLGLFFVTVGMFLDVGQIILSLPAVLAMLAALVFGPVAARTDAPVLPVAERKTVLVINSYHCGDLLERKPVVFDHGGGFSYSEIVQITGDACSYLRFKNTAQIAGT